MGLTNDPPCKPLILLVSGYNLKIRGSNPLSTTNSLIINDICSRFYFILFYLLNKDLVNSMYPKYRYTLRNIVTDELQEAKPIEPR